MKLLILCVQRSRPYRRGGGAEISGDAVQQEQGVPPPQTQLSRQNYAICDSYAITFTPDNMTIAQSNLMHRNGNA